MIESYLYGMVPITESYLYGMVQITHLYGMVPITLFVWNGTNYPSLFLLDFVYRIIEQVGA